LTWRRKSIYNAQVGAEEARRLREVLARLALETRSGLEKADAFEQAALEIQAASGGTWEASRMTATDGGVVFAGRQSEVVVFAGDGTIFRGKSGSWRLTRAGIALDYAKLVKL
jgi:hypothetical protein